MVGKNKKQNLLRCAVVLLLVCLMTGCATLPPALSFLGYIKTGADGISYLASHKSTTDHLVSSARDQDCAMHRVLWDEEMCREYEEDTAMIVALKKRALNAKPAAGSQGESVPQIP